MAKSVWADKEHEQIVQAGIPAIREALFGEPYLAQQILLTLDLHLDPYYKQPLPYEREIYTLLEELIVTSRDDDVLEDAVHLLGYARCPLPILEQNIDKVKDSVKPDVLYILHAP